MNLLGLTEGADKGVCCTTVNKKYEERSRKEAEGAIHYIVKAPVKEQMLTRSIAFAIAPAWVSSQR